MVLPTKHLKTESSIIYIGGIIHKKIENPIMIDKLWHNVKNEYIESFNGKTITYDWFVLALTFLHTVDMIQLSKNGEIIRSFTGD